MLLPRSPPFFSRLCAVFSSDCATLSSVVGSAASVWLLTVCASVGEAAKTAKRLPTETMHARRLSKIMAPTSEALKSRLLNPGSQIQVLNHSDDRHADVKKSR